jgi:hypothetical protein
MDRNRWILLVKELRAEHDVSIYAAERRALADPRWRRWVDQQINTDARCRRMALHHLLHNGTSSLIERDGERFKVR